MSFRRVFRIPAFTKRHLRGDVDDEIAAHIEHRVEHLVARGVPEDTARAEANDLFGGASARDRLYRSAARRNGRASIRGWIDALAFDLRAGARVFAHAPSFAFPALVSVTLGISVGAALLSVVEQGRRGPMPFANADRASYLYLDSPTCRTGRCWSFPLSMLTELRRVPSSVKVEGYATGAVQIREQDMVFGARTVRTTVGLPEALGVKMAVGRAYGNADSVGPPVAMLSHALWVKRFAGSPAVVGSKLKLSGVEHVITGVLAAEAAFPSEGTEIWTSALSHGPAPKPSTETSIVTLAGSGEGDRASIDSAATSIARVAGPGHELDRVVALGFREYMLRSVKDLFGALALFAGFIGAIAAVNFAGLLLARGMRRRATTGVRAALGASVRRLAWHTVGEALIICAVGGLAGAVMAPATVGVLRYLIADFFPPWITPTLGPLTIAGAIVCAVVLGLMFAIGPAIDLARPALADFIRAASGTPTVALRRARVTVVVAQIAIATAILVVMGTKVDHLLSGWIAPAGIPYKEIVVAQPGLDKATIDAGRIDVQGLLDVANQTAGVRAAAMISDAGRWSSFNGVPLLNGDAMQWLRATPSFFRVSDIRLVSGRLPSASDTRVAVITNALAEALPNDVLGTQVKLDDLPAPVTIVGIVTDFRFRGQDFRSTPAIITMEDPAAFPISARQYPWIWIRTDGPTSIARRAIASAFFTESRVYEIAPLAERYQVAEDRRRGLVTFVMLVFGIALGLAALGLGALVSYTTELRWRELAIREALGSSRARVGMLIVRSAGKSGAIGLIAGSLLGTGVLISFTPPMAKHLTLPSVDGVIAAASFVAVVVLLASAAPLIALWRRHLAQTLRD